MKALLEHTAECITVCNVCRRARVVLMVVGVCEGDRVNAAERLEGRSDAERRNEGTK
jgi:hypothetical protein